jgi:molecular chaperone HtpG
MAVGEYEGKVFRSVTRAGDGLTKIKSETNDKNTAENKESAATGDLSSLIALIKISLGDAIKDVRTSERLTSSPVCLVSDEGDLDIHLERFLKQHNQIRTPSKRILELNPKHALILKMSQQTKAAGASDRLGDIAWLLFDQARLLDGETLADPIAFSQRMERVLETAAAA